MYNKGMETPFETRPPKRLKKVSPKHIRAVVEQIVSTFHPEKIILFGSYAYGKPSTWSDLDLLVIMDAPKGEVETALAMRKILPPYPFSIDILVRSAKTIEQRKAMGDGFLQEITQRGKVMYERANKSVFRVVMI
jgi:predicted nucleotidyltransferase